MDMHWIWLDDQYWPELQNTFCTIFADREGYQFGVADFERHYRLDKPIQRVRLLVSGDTKFRLWLNGAFVGVGPVAAGGDYGNQLAMPKYYANHYEVETTGQDLHFFAQVQLSPVVMTDYSCGRGGFALTCEIEFCDGSSRRVVTDESWYARANGAFLSATELDLTIPADAWRPAKTIDSVWNLVEAPIPPLAEQLIKPVGPNEITLAPGESAQLDVAFDKIYSGYLCLDMDAAGLATIEARFYENKADHLHTSEKITTVDSCSYRGLRLQSIGGYLLNIQNHGAANLRVHNIGLIFTCYPVTAEGHFACSDPEIGKIYDVGKWTTQICRQTLHLDSPLHQETLGCTGDYFIESLISYFAFGDARLVRLDLVRTADWLRLNDGIMFHTSYSLIWVQMLYNYYIFTGDTGVFADVQDVLEHLLERFHHYLGKHGVIERAPNYMFVDWIMVDGYTMHHPPQALGQTCLNAFYYQALADAARIFAVIGDGQAVARYNERATALKEAFGDCFYDAAAQLYVDGMNTPTDTNEWLPPNTSKRYYSKHANALAVLYGLCEGESARRIMRRVSEGSGMTDVQPYFSHFILDAFAKVDLFEECGLKLIDRWRDMVRVCDKGMQEGWINPGNYTFDYSHAWGGSPTYQLPCRLLGFRMIEPGFRKIELKPRLFGLEWADIEMPTPFGPLKCEMKAGAEPQLTLPKEISCILL